MRRSRDAALSGQNTQRLGCLSVCLSACVTAGSCWRCSMSCSRQDASACQRRS